MEIKNASRSKTGQTLQHPKPRSGCTEVHGTPGVTREGETVSVLGSPAHQECLGRAMRWHREGRKGAPPPASTECTKFGQCIWRQSPPRAIREITVH